MKANLFPAIKLTIVTIVLFGGIYTFLIWGIAQFAPGGGNGKTSTAQGHVYYENVGQSFKADRYFQSRPSAVNYNAAGSGGSNKGPSNPEYLALVQARIDTFLVHNPGVDKASVPVELVTASGSGLDPDISPEAASVQIARIARVRKLSAGVVRHMVEDHVQTPFLGLFGPSKVNVLQLNLALDALK